MIDIPIMLFDGTCVSKAGAGAAAAVLLMPNGRRYTVSQFLSKATIEEAAYRGLLIGLQKAQKLGIRQLEIKGDNEIVFHQVNGSYQIKEQHLRELHQQAIKLLRKFEVIRIELIPKDQNRSAAAAVSRCIGEALGIDTQTETHKAAQITPNVAKLIKLGNKATEEDYKQLIAEEDDFTLKTITELRQIVPNSIRDEIALHWDGKDEHLAEIYRWYLRGLSTELAIHKVEIDTQTQISEIQIDKLPWEGELQTPTILEQLDFDASNPFLSPPEPPNSLSLDVNQNLIQITQDPLAEIITPEIENPISTSPELIVSSDPDPDQQDKHHPNHTDYSKDTLPGDEKIKYIVDLIEGLSREEKTHLIQELVKLPDLANLMLKAIAEIMNGK